MSENVPLEDPVEEGKRVVDAADERGLTVRLIGGTAVWIHAETARDGPFEREYRDVDFVGTREEETEIVQLMKDLGYDSNRRFNTMRRYRLEFHDDVNGRKADYCIDRFVFCHEWDLRGRIDLDWPTVPIEDLLLSKLQIYEPSDRDIRDVIAMLADHPIQADDDGEHVNETYVAGLCSTDWGLYRTVTLSLDRVESYVHENDLPLDKSIIRSRLEDLHAAIENEPKSVRWRLRSVIGERKQWYKQPELG